MDGKDPAFFFLSPFESTKGVTVVLRSEISTLMGGAILMVAWIAIVIPLLVVPCTNITAVTN